MEKITRKKRAQTIGLKQLFFPYSEGKAPDVGMGSSVITFPQITLPLKIILAKGTTHPVKGT